MQTDQYRKVRYAIDKILGAIDGIDDQAVRASLLSDHHIEIGRGLGDFAGKVWRIGLMGDSARETNVFALLSALEMTLSGMNFEVAHGASLAAAQRALADFDAAP